MGGIVRTALLPAPPNCVLGGHTSNALAILVTRAQVLRGCARRTAGYRKLGCGAAGILQGHRRLGRPNPAYGPRPGQPARTDPDGGLPVMRMALPLPGAPQMIRHGDFLPDDDRPIPDSRPGWREPETRSTYPLSTETMVPQMPRSIPCRRGVSLVTRRRYFFRRVTVSSAV